MCAMTTTYRHTKSSSEGDKPIQRSAKASRPTAKQADPAEIIQRIRMNPASLTNNDVMQLQSTIGNRAVIKLLSQANGSQKPMMAEKPMQMKRGNGGKVNPRTYVVRSGDTLGKIASEYDTTVDELVRLNNIKNKNKIFVGQVIILPTATTTDKKSVEHKPKEDAKEKTQNEASGNSSGFVWPLPTSHNVTSPYGETTKLHPSGHKGLDIADKKGSDIVAAFDGDVVIAQALDGYGNVVYINSLVNGKHIQTRYAHMQSIDAKAKTHVTAGQTIGKVGSTGRSTGPHLHFEIRESNNGKACGVSKSATTAVDPGNYIQVTHSNNPSKKKEKPKEKKIENKDTDVKTYVVKPGDTLGKIASKYSTTVEELVRANNIENKNQISVGQVLILQTSAASEKKVEEHKQKEDTEAAGKTGTYTYENRYGKTVKKEWTISDEEFLDSNSLTQEQITDICNKNNSGLAERGFDKAIYQFAKNKGINPKVLLATLAQEQGWCKRGNYKSAFGVGPGGNPLDFAEGDKGGMAIAVNTFLKWFNKGLALEKSGKLGPMFVNHDPSPYPETKAVFGGKTKEWQKNHPSDVEFMENGQNVTPVNAAMYAKLKYTPWVDFPAQGSHPLDDWHRIFRSFK